MSTQLITASYSDAITINFTSNAWFNATAVAKNFGKRPVEWLRLDSTIEYINNLIEIQKCDNPTFDKNQLVMLKKGNPENGGGSWMHPKLAIRFAQWLDAKFAVWCDMQIEKILHPVTTPQPTIPAPERKTKKALPGCLTLEMQDNIKAKVKDRVLHLPANKQAGQIIKQWSAIKQKFGCTYKEIPADEYLNVISLIERLPIEGELLDPVKQKQEIATMTEYDYQRARESLANIRKAAESSVDDSMLSAMFAEIEALEKCLVSAWTHFDESLLRLSTVITFQKRWRGAK